MVKMENLKRFPEFNADQLQMLISAMAVSQQQPKKYLTSKEAGKFLGKTANAMRILVHREEIQSYKKGERLYFLESDLMDWIESGRRLTSSEIIKGCEEDLMMKGGNLYA